jgi:t-SNARE complex subunit (syntaxin)
MRRASDFGSSARQQCYAKALQTGHALRFAALWSRVQQSEAALQEERTRAETTLFDTDGVSMVLDQDVSEEQALLEEQQRRENAQLEQDVHEISRQVLQLHQMFLQLNVTVTGQGTMLDHINNTLVEAREEVVEGVNLLGEAEKYQDKSTKCFFIYIIGIIVLIIIIGGLVWRKKARAQEAG